MLELIIMIFIGVVVYKRVRRLKEDSSVSGNQSGPNTTVTQHSASGRPAMPVSGNPGTKKAPQKAPVKSAIEEAKKDGNSTTAYLMEKAEEDAKQHAKEKYEEQKRLYETRGGLAVAERYLDGDLIPQGKRCVKCGYCGAENLVPMVPRTRYRCYFCREPLSS